MAGQSESRMVFPMDQAFLHLAPGRIVHRHRGQSQGGWQPEKSPDAPTRAGSCADWALQKLTTIGEALSGDPSGNT